MKTASRLIRAAVQRDVSLLAEPAQSDYFRKASITPLPVAELIASGSGAQAEMLATFVESSLFNLSRGWNAVPSNTPVLAASALPTMRWTGENKPIACSVPNFDQVLLQAINKIGGIVPVTRDAARLGGNSFEVWLENACLQAANAALNEALLDPNNDGTDESPAAITHGAAALVSVGNPIDDLQALVQDFAGDLSRAILVTDHATAIALDAHLGARGQYLSERLPLFAVRGSPRASAGGQITLVDPATVAVAFAGVEFVASENAAIQVDTAPDDPAAAATVMISGFHQNLAFYRLVVQLEWRRLVTGAVRYVTGAAYTGA